MALSHPGMAITVAERVAFFRQCSVQEVLQACRSNMRDMYGIWRMWLTDKEGLALRHNRASKVKHQLIRKDGWILVNNVLHVIAIRQLYHSATWLSVDGPYYVVLYTLMDNKQQGFISFILICCSFEILL